jgi:2-hydroxychromene-2-carboxylate isomerase
MRNQVEFFFDYGSPYSYLADTRLPALADRTGATIVYKPMLLGAVFKATGNSSPAASPVQSKLQYGVADLSRWARHYGVPFRLNPNFPINTLRLMRGAVAAQQSGDFPQFHRAVFAAIWQQDENMGDDTVVRDVLEKAGIDGRALWERTGSAEVKDLLRTNTEEAVRRGAFGAPTFFVGDEMYWGNDRLLFVEAALVASARD